MKGLPFYDPVIRIVEKISWKRMPDVHHMYPDLMGASGFQMKLSKGIGLSVSWIGVGHKAFEMGDSFFPV